MSTVVVATRSGGQPLLTHICLQIREGFIVDEDEEEEADDSEERERRRKKKRRRAEREEEEQLDEEDLDLIGEANPEWERKTQAQVSYLSALQSSSGCLWWTIDEVQAPEAGSPG